jgi:hypothetical protein
LGSRYFVILRLLDESQPHDHPFGRIEEIHPLIEFKRFGAEQTGARGRQAVRYGIESDVLIPRPFAVVPAQRVAGDFK